MERIEWSDLRQGNSNEIEAPDIRKTCGNKRDENVAMSNAVEPVRISEKL